ncbi:MAG: DUF58 domain-containing protein [Proteobacteria bacterium]|nr:DUF58 domain-containing protein [Pseudomonadota bacterium]
MLPSISPELRARLRELRLAARHASGDGLGQHVSRSRGAGLEFAQYRAYEPGDELRRIDWKLYARSDRYFVREAERDSPLTAWLVLDASASMRQCDAARPHVSKLDAAKTLAACTIELALRQGDRFGVLALGGTTPTFVPAASGARQRDRCLLELARLNAGGGGPDASALTPLWERIQSPAMVLLLSDFFDDAIVDVAVRLAIARREVLSVQLLTAEERDFPFVGGHRFVDPETGSERRVDAASVRDEYLDCFSAARAALAQRFAAVGIGHVDYTLDRPLIEPLRALFAPTAGRGMATEAAT